MSILNYYIHYHYQFTVHTYFIEFNFKRHNLQNASSRVRTIFGHIKPKCDNCLHAMNTQSTSLHCAWCPSTSDVNALHANVVSPLSTISNAWGIFVCRTTWSVRADDGGVHAHPSNNCSRLRGRSSMLHAYVSMNRSAQKNTLKFSFRRTRTVWSR